MTTSTAIQFLYIVASGWNDGVYKIGISSNPEVRLEQIKRDYDTPHAYIVETMDVPTREEVFAVENALHERFDAQKADHYKGREWFELSASDLRELKAMYQAESNAFAQCTAYHGLLQARDAIALVADEMELERQTQIRFNRVNGRTYDTRPQGALKRYNELQKKIRSSTLGERFTTRKYSHPVKGLFEKINSTLLGVVESQLEGLWWKMGASGVAAGVVLASAFGSTSPGGVVGMTGMTGVIAGVATSGARKETEEQLIKADSEAWVTNQFGQGLMHQTMLAIWDRKDERGFLLRDFNESTEQLREVHPRIPAIPSTVPEALKTKYRTKSYFPVIGTVVTGVMCLITSIGSAEEMQERAFVEPSQQTPIVRLLDKA